VSTSWHICAPDADGGGVGCFVGGDVGARYREVANRGVGCVVGGCREIAHRGVGCVDGGCGRDICTLWVGAAGVIGVSAHLDAASKTAAVQAGGQGRAGGRGRG